MTEIFDQAKALNDTKIHAFAISSDVRDMNAEIKTSVPVTISAPRFDDNAIELIDVLKQIAGMRGTTIEHEIMKHNVEVTERAREHGRTPPAANKEEWDAREKARRRREVDKARLKRVAARGQDES